MTRRALFLTTALSVSLAGGLAGCAGGGGSQAYQLPVAQQVAQANRQAAESAALSHLNAIEPAAGRGTVLLTRTEAVPTPEEEQSLLRQLAEQVVAEKQDTIIKQAAAESQSYADTVTGRMAARVAEDLRTYANANVSATAAELKDYAYRVAGEAASQQASATEARLTATTTSELANLRLENARLQQKLTQQSQVATSVTVQEVAKLRAENARLQAEMTEKTQSANTQVAQRTSSEIDRLREENARMALQLREQQAAVLAQASTQVAALKETTDAKLAAVKDITGVQIAATQQQNETLLSRYASQADARMSALKETTDAKLAAVKETTVAQTQATAAQVAALQETTDARLAAVKDITGVQIAATQQQNETLLSRYASQADARMSALKETTDAKLASLSDQQQVTRQLAQLEIQRVNETLRQYADQEFARQQSETKQSLTQVAEAARLDVLDLEAATDRRLEEIQRTAGARAAMLSSRVSARLEAELARAEESQLKPDQVKQLAEGVVADATPQFRALALQTLAQSQDYIRTVAKDSIKDADPAVQEALAEAARQVITKDDKVVFAIREAVDKQLKQANVAAAEDANRTLLGPDHIPGDTTAPDIITADDIAIDAKHLGVKAPGSENQGVSTPERARQVASASPPSLGAARHRNDWVDLRSYRVVVHEDDRTLEQILGKVLAEAEPFTGPWEVKWKISATNKDIMAEKFSLDAETSFEEFINYLAQYMTNDRGVKLTVNLFDAQRVMVITD